MQSESIVEITKALVKVQGALKPSAKDSTNPHYNTKYSNLRAVWDACRTLLSENGLAVAQTFSGGENGNIIISTTLLHSSGEWFRSDLSLTPQKPGPQAIGSLITYGRRYGLAAIVGVYDLDDDGEGAERSTKKTPTKTPTKATPTKPEDREEVKALRELYALSGVPLENATGWMKSTGKDTFAELTEAQIRTLTGKIKGFKEGDDVVDPAAPDYKIPNHRGKLLYAKMKSLKWNEGEEAELLRDFGVGTLYAVLNKDYENVKKMLTTLADSEKGGA